MSGGFGSTASRRRQAARKHADRVHVCPLCSREIRGNGYYRHRESCRRLNKKETKGGAVERGLCHRYVLYSVSPRRVRSGGEIGVAQSAERRGIPRRMRVRSPPP